jgi:hypothetical protein
MDLAIARQLGARPVEGDRRVEEFIAGAFDKAAAMHEHAVVTRHLAQGFIGRPARAPGTLSDNGQLFGSGALVGDRTPHESEDFGQDQHIRRVGLDRAQCQRARLFQVGGFVAAGIHLKRRDLHIRMVTQLNIPVLRSTPALASTEKSAS